MCFDFEVELLLNRIMNVMDVGTFTIIRYLFPGVIMTMMTMMTMKMMMTIKMLVVRLKKIEAGMVVEMVEMVELVAVKVVEWAVELVRVHVMTANSVPLRKNGGQRHASTTSLYSSTSERIFISVTDFPEHSNIGDQCIWRGLVDC